MGTFKDGGSAAGPTSYRLYLMWPKFRASAANYAGLLLFLDRGFEPAGLRRMLLLSPAQVATATQALCQTRGPSGGRRTGTGFSGFHPCCSALWALKSDGR